MIDRIALQVDFPHSPRGTRYKFLPEGKAANEGHAWEKNFSFSGAFDEIEFHSLYEGRAIEIRFCPGKIYQGHNVFGSNKVHALIMNALECVANEIGVPLTEAQRKHYDSGAYTLLELHVTEMIDVLHTEIPALLQHLVYALPKACGVVRKSEGESIEFTSIGGNATISLYDKLSEIENKRKMPKTLKRLTALLGKEKALKAFEILRLACIDRLRVEIKFHREGLRNLKLESGEAWRLGSATLARKIFTSELDAMDFGAYSPMRRSKSFDGLEDANWTLRGLVAVWLLGEDPRRGMSTKTFEKWRDVARKVHRIDLEANPPRLLHDFQQIKLDTLLTAENIVKRPNLPAGFEALWSDGESLAELIRLEEED